MSRSFDSSSYIQGARVIYSSLPVFVRTPRQVPGLQKRLRVKILHPRYSPYRALQYCKPWEEPSQRNLDKYQDYFLLRYNPKALFRSLRQGRPISEASLSGFGSTCCRCCGCARPRGAVWGQFRCQAWAVFFVFFVFFCAFCVHAKCSATVMTRTNMMIILTLLRRKISFMLRTS